MTAPAPQGPRRAYAPVHGLDLYYEIHGSGRPLVLLHGGLLTIELTFGSLIPTLAEHHQVIGVELQGHGHTADIDRPMNLDTLADDVAALLGELGLAPADVFGYSLGGAVALNLAVRRPDLVGRLVLASVDYRPDHSEMGVPATEEDARRLPTEQDFQAMRDAYAATAPDPARFLDVAEKTSAMIAAWDGWSDDELRAIRVPTLLLVGDTDFVPVDHAAAMLRLIPAAQLAVLPDTTHMGVMRRPDLLLALVRPFLDPAEGASSSSEVEPQVARLSGVSYLRIPAVSAEGSAAFYQAVFGWEIRGDPSHRSFTDGTGHVIGAWDTGLDAAGEAGARPYVYVAAVDDTLAAITAHGGEVVQDPYPEGDLWVATFRDPAGNVLGVWQQGPR